MDRCPEDSNKPWYESDHSGKGKGRGARQAGTASSGPVSGEEKDNTSLHLIVEPERVHTVEDTNYGNLKTNDKRGLHEGPSSVHRSSDVVDSWQRD